MGAGEEGTEIGQTVHQIWVVVSGGRVDEGHKGAILDVFIITHDMNSIFSWFLGPILDITRSIILVVIVDLRLGRAFNGKPWRMGWKDLSGYMVGRIYSMLLPTHSCCLLESQKLARNLKCAFCPFSIKPRSLGLH